MAESDGDSSTVPTPHFKDMDDEASSTSSGPTGPVEPRPPRFMSTPQILTRQSAPEVLAAATAAAAAKNPKQTEQGRSDGQPEAEKQESDSAAAVEQHEEQDVDKKHDSDMRKGSLEVPQGIEIGKDPNQQVLMILCHKLLYGTLRHIL